MRRWVTKWVRGSKSCLGASEVVIPAWVFCCYLSVLGVHRDLKGHGIGAGLMDATKKHIGPEVGLILSSVPEAVGFCERIGMPQLPNGYWFRREQ